MSGELDFGSGGGDGVGAHWLACVVRWQEEAALTSLTYSANILGMYSFHLEVCHS